jgi:hypothetical protein
MAGVGLGADHAHVIPRRTRGHVRRLSSRVLTGDARFGTSTLNDTDGDHGLEHPFRDGAHDEQLSCDAGRSPATDMSSSPLSLYEPLDIIGNGSFGIIRKVRRKSDGLVSTRCGEIL